MNCIQYWSFVLLLRLHLEYADYVESRILLESFIKAEIRTHEICSVPSDGLCILRAFKECNESVSGELIAMEDLKDRLRTEMSLSVNQTLYPDISVWVMKSIILKKSFGVLQQWRLWYVPSCTWQYV